MNTKIVSIAAAAGLFIGSTAIGYAQNPARDSAPGQQMQEKGSVPGQPGASGYAPGQKMQEKGSKSGSPGASGYAPGPRARPVRVAARTRTATAPNRQRGEDGD